MLQLQLPLIAKDTVYAKSALACQASFVSKPRMAMVNPSDARAITAVHSAPSSLLGSLRQPAVFRARTLGHRCRNQTLIIQQPSEDTCQLLLAVDEAS